MTRSMQKEKMHDAGTMAGKTEQGGAEIRKEEKTEDSRSKGRKKRRRREGTQSAYNETKMQPCLKA